MVKRFGEFRLKTLCAQTLFSLSLKNSATEPNSNRLDGDRTRLARTDDPRTAKISRAKAKTPRRHKPAPQAESDDPTLLPNHLPHFLKNAFFLKLRVSL